MSALDEPSYLAFARAAARNNESVSGTVVRELVARIERDASALKASKPRTITTVEELNALPNGSIILEVDGNPLRANREGGRNWWLDGPDAMSGSPLIPLPVTVLHEPKSA